VRNVAGAEVDLNHFSDWTYSFGERNFSAKRAQIAYRAVLAGISHRTNFAETSTLTETVLDGPSNVRDTNSGFPQKDVNNVLLTL
jgi:hypothetical protein